MILLQDGLLVLDSVLISRITYQARSIRPKTLELFMYACHLQTLPVESDEGVGKDLHPYQPHRAAEHGQRQREK